MAEGKYRWTIQERNRSLTVQGHSPPRAPDGLRRVEVMPVSEHEAVLKAERKKGAELTSLRSELARLLGPREPREGITANDQWIAAVAVVLDRAEKAREDALRELRIELESERRSLEEEMRLGEQESGGISGATDLRLRGLRSAIACLDSLAKERPDGE